MSTRTVLQVRAGATPVVPLLRLPDVTANYTRLLGRTQGLPCRPLRGCSLQEVPGHLHLLRCRLGDLGASVAVYPSAVCQCYSYAILHDRRLWKGPFQSIGTAASLYEVCGNAAFLGYARGAQAPSPSRSLDGPGCIPRAAPSGLPSTVLPAPQVNSAAQLDSRP